MKRFGVKILQNKIIQFILFFKVWYFLCKEVVLWQSIEISLIQLERRLSQGEYTADKLPLA